VLSPTLNSVEGNKAYAGTVDTNYAFFGGSDSQPGATDWQWRIERIGK
jgi:hypothetical protein